MKKNNRSPRGQAIILIVFGMVALIGMTALAIDGGNVYADRRHAQNAADTAALAGALADIRGQDWQSVALSRASDNGYNNDGLANTVEAYLCSDSASSCGVYAGNNQYLQIIITSRVQTYFAPVVGIRDLTNKVNAIARAQPGTNTALFNGNALVGLNKTACKAVQYQGNASLIINDLSGGNSGIFANSNCSSGTNGAFNTNTGAGSIDVPCLSVVGSITAGVNSHLNDHGCQPTTSQLANPTSTYPTPNITCGDQIATIQPDGVTISPGYWSGAFPPAGVTTMQSGTYCLDTANRGFTLHGGQTLTGKNVLIKMVSGAVSWNSGGVNLTAPPVGTYYGGLLLYLAPPDCSKITINGNGSSTLTGTILAPCSLVSIEGGASGAGYNNQIIADTLSLSGNSNIVINYQANQNWQPPQSPTIQLAK